MKIKIKDSQRKITINKKDVTYLAKLILKIKGIEEAELSISFVGKKCIRALNKKFRKIDQPTDVLAFSMREGQDTKLHPAPVCKGGFHSEILGDVVICPEIARKFAKIYKTTEQFEICLCLVHGILHLLGYDDISAKNRFRMEKEQARILKRVCPDEEAKHHSKF